MSDRTVGEHTRSERVWLVLGLVMLSTCVAQAFGRFTWGVVLPEARDDLLGGSNSLAGFFATLNVSAYLAGTVLVAWASTRVTLVGLMRIGVAISTTALGIAAFAPSGPVLGVALVAMGLGGAVIWIPAPAIAARWLPPGRSGLAVGLVGSGIGLGLVFAGQTAAFLRRGSDADDVWQTLYRIEFSIALVVLVGAFAFIRSTGDRPGATGGLGGFGALRTVTSWVPLTIAYASFGFAYILVIGFLVARLEDDAGFTSGQAAATFSLVGIATAAGGLTIGTLSDHVGRRLMLIGAFAVFGGSTLLVLTGEQPWVAIAALGIGLTFSGMPSLIIAHLVEHTDVDTYGPAFSAATLAFGVTQMVSPQIGGLIADAAGSFTPVFLLSAVVSAIGTAAVTRLP